MVKYLISDVNNLIVWQFWGIVFKEFCPFVNNVQYLMNTMRFLNSWLHKFCLTFQLTLSNQKKGHYRCFVSNSILSKCPNVQMYWTLYIICFVWRVYPTDRPMCNQKRAANHLLPPRTFPKLDCILSTTGCFLTRYFCQVYFI